MEEVAAETGREEKPVLGCLGTTPPSGTQRTGRALYLAEIRTLLHWCPLALSHLSPNMFSAYCSYSPKPMQQRAVWFTGLCTKPRQKRPLTLQFSPRNRPLALWSNYSSRTNIQWLQKAAGQGNHNVLKTHQIVINQKHGAFV